MKFVFVLEAGQNIGFGHLKRSIVIAQFIRDRYSKNIRFFINNEESIMKVLKHSNFRYSLLLDKAEIHEIHDSIVIIDSKKNVDHWLELFNRNNGNNKYILLDNTSVSRLMVDLCIIPTVNPLSNLSWEGMMGKYYIGASYIPVNKKYLQARRNFEKLEFKKPFNVLITMGGSDPNNLTHYILQSLRDVNIKIKIMVVIGPGFTNIDKLIQLANGMNNVDLYHNQNNLAKFMEKSHLAFTAVGTTIYELATVGVPTIIIGNYESDISDLRVFRDLKINLPLGVYSNVTNSEIINETQTILSNEQEWYEISQNARNLIDGAGTERIVELIINKLK